jgi:hypothetical protein
MILAVVAVADNSAATVDFGISEAVFIDFLDHAGQKQNRETLKYLQYDRSRPRPLATLVAVFSIDS